MVRLPGPLRAFRLLHLGLYLLAFAAPVLAQNVPVSDAQPPAHVSFVDGAVILERDGGTDDSPSSMPLLAG